MQDLGLIVDHDPKWFILTVPSVTPFKVRNESHLNLKDGSGDRLAMDINVKVRNVTCKFVKLILAVRRKEPLCRAEVSLVDHV